MREQMCSVINTVERVTGEYIDLRFHSLLLSSTQVIDAVEWSNGRALANTSSSFPRFPVTPYIGD